jgi:aldehyde dehydrogenase (NAD+)
VVLTKKKKKKKKKKKNRYTGSTMVGKIVMQAAAKHLTPVLLELGGKSPTFVDRNCNLAVAARRIVWGKFSNCGQTCVAPDYVLVHRDVEAEFHRLIKSTILEFYGEDPSTSEDFSRIINSRHTARVAALIEDARKYVVHGGQKIDTEKRFIEPTVLRNPPADAAVMQDEIFGPVLPVIAIPSIDSGIDFVNQRERPLALYVFSSDKAVAERVLSRTASGGAAINDTTLHIVMPDLPFGGIGHSGMGHYNGIHTFLAFSHDRTVLWKPDSALLDPPVRYPPMTSAKKAIFFFASDIEDSFKSIAPLWFILIGAWMTWAFPASGKLF